MIYITARHMAGGNGHEHIAAIRWRQPSDNTTGEMTQPVIVEWIRDKGGDARVTDGTNEVKVGVWEASPPYIRTYADNKWTDNLLALPEY